MCILVVISGFSLTQESAKWTKQNYWGCNILKNYESQDVSPDTLKKHPPVSKHCSLEPFNGMYTSVLDVAISHASNMNNVATITLGMVFLFCLEMIVECPISWFFPS